MQGRGSDQTEAIDKVNETEEFEPTPENGWDSVCLTIRAARQFALDLNEAIEHAIQGPPEDDE